MTDAERITAKVNQVRTRLFLVLLANFMAVAVCGVVLVAVLAGFRNESAGRPIVLAAVAVRADGRAPGVSQDAVGAGDRGTGRSEIGAPAAIGDSLGMPAVP
jgi:hypothetical protein